MECAPPVTTRTALGPRLVAPLGRACSLIHSRKAQVKVGAVVIAAEVLLPTQVRATDERDCARRVGPSETSWDTGV
jgi:hypothetical protein